MGKITKTAKHESALCHAISRVLVYRYNMILYKKGGDECGHMMRKTGFLQIFVLSSNEYCHNTINIIL